MKKINFNAKPTSTRPASTVDAWVENREITEQKPLEPMKRLTIDVRVSLHKRIKSQCAMADLVMADEIREMLEKRFPPLPGEETFIPKSDQSPS